jgi:homoserine dehydrogenase
MHTNTHLILLGAGKVGREVIRLIQACGLPIRFTAITDSQLFVIGNPLQPAVIQAVFDAKASGQWLIEFSGALPLHKPSAYYQADAIVVGTSASRSLDLLPALQAGCKLVFVNKNALSAPWRMATPPQTGCSGLSEFY